MGQGIAALALGTDDWYVNCVLIKLANGDYLPCPCNLWLDDSSGYSMSKTVQCLGGKESFSHAISYLLTSENFVEKRNKIPGIRIYTGRDDWRACEAGYL